MIEILFLQLHEKTVGFQISGHSDLNPNGEDLLCCAVSVLSENCINSIEQLAKDKPIRFALNEEEGFMHFQLSEPTYEAELLLKSFMVGIEGLREEYGKYLRIGSKEVEQ